MGDEPRPMSLAERITFQREKKGWSQRQLAMRAGINYAFISRLEDGTRTDILLSVVRKLARALGVSVSYFVDTEEGETDSPNYSPEGVLLLADMARLPVPTLMLEDR
jgi:transcriptional regulator with XRE-family HTH domain